MALLEAGALDRFRSALQLADAKVAGPWELVRDELKYDEKLKRKVSAVSYVRRTPRGADVARAGYYDGKAQWWTSETFEMQDAESLGEALLEAECRLQADGWEVLAKMVLLG